MRERDIYSGLFGIHPQANLLITSAGSGSGVRSFTLECYGVPGLAARPCMMDKYPYKGTELYKFYLLQSKSLMC